MEKNGDMEMTDTHRRWYYHRYGNQETCPKYYGRYTIEPNTFCMVNKLGCAESNIIKYICRHDMKDGLKDLKKAQDYLGMLIEHHYGRDKV